ncbi:MAG: glycosyl hydrolase family 65 protein [Planctomycetota bacterium]
MAYDTWNVVNTSAHPRALAQWNSVGAVSNGYIGLKGNLAEQRHHGPADLSGRDRAAPGFSPVTLINGVYDELDMFGQLRASNEERRYLDPRYFDTAGRSPAVANLPNPLFVQTYVGEQEVTLGRGEVLNFVQSLDLATGVYRYSFDYRDGAGRMTRIEMERFACLRHAHRVFMRYSVTPLDHGAPIRIRSGIDGAVFSNTTRERQFDVAERWGGPAERVRLTARTPAREHIVKMGVVNRVRGVGQDTTGAVGHGGPTLQEPSVAVLEHDAVWTYYILAPEQGETVTIERTIVVTCSEDLRHGPGLGGELGHTTGAGQSLVVDLERELDAAEQQGFDAALAEQRTAWRELWDRCDVQIEGDDPAQLGLRFCLFHLLQAAPRFTDRLSVPVKLLTGEYYQGNTFYDTDTYILPFYTFTLPELARTCLNFRCEGLRPGREIARNLGYDGAKFAWQAGPYGEECLGRWWRFTHTNIHINADVAYALVQYWQATGDDRYMAERGIDVLVETARFFASRAKHDPARDRYDIHDVAGPDEGHCESTNNFYTNYLAIRNLRWAAEMLDHLAATAAEAHAAALRRLALREDEPRKWRHVADRLTLLFDPQTRVYEQCAGFCQLKPLPPDLLEGRKVWFVTVFPYQALNQPDVVMAMILFRDAFSADVRRANWDFYKDKSLNFSSMSFALNAIMAADMGDLAEAYRNFIITCGADLDEGLTGRRDTYAGLHGTACGGAWMAAVFGFGGVQIKGDKFNYPRLCINPNLPPQWSALRFKIVLRGVPVKVAIDRTKVVLLADGDLTTGLPLEVCGTPVYLKGSEPREVRYGKST